MTPRYADPSRLTVDDIEVEKLVHQFRQGHDEGQPLKTIRAHPVSSWLLGAHHLERWLMENSILPCVVELSLLLCEGGAATRLIISR